MKPLQPVSAVTALALLLPGCASTPHTDAHLPSLRYVGSSTIANFIRDAEPAYGRVRFVLDTAPESAGGELALREGRADLAGVAGRPDEDTLGEGVAATLIARDAIAVIVHPGNPVESLTREQLEGIFTGAIRNWRELAGPDLAIRPFIVGPESSTRTVFRAAILGEAVFGGCEVLRPDSRMLDMVAAEPGAIGQISVSFLDARDRVKPLAVDGRAPFPTDPAYAISRGLYLLWWPGRARVADFVSWTSSAEAQAILMKRFAGPPPTGAAQ